MGSGASNHDLLRIENLDVSFEVMGGPLHAVRGASLRVLPGKVTALVGESGSGKSVISQAVMGILPTVTRVHGSITFHDPETDKTTDLLNLPQDGPEFRSLRGRRLAMIFQEPMTSLSPLHAIGDQVSEPLKVHSTLASNEIRERTIAMLDLVGFREPARAFDMYPFELSGGLRQRAMIAMALICHPALLIADEPTTALDVTIQAQILHLLRDLRANLGMAMLLITHDLGVVANIADEVVLVHQGQIMEAGPVEEIFRRPAHPYLKGLMAAVPHFDMRRDERLKPLREARVNVSDLIRKPLDTASDETSSSLLVARNLSKTFVLRGANWFGVGHARQIQAVCDVSFEIGKGECLGLVGESGCGKTTVARILMRAITPDGGEVTFNGSDGPVDVLLARKAALQSIRAKIQMVFQDPVSSLSPRMTIQNILTEPLEIHRRGDAQSRREQVIALLRAVGLGERALNRYPHSFSGGQRQRIGIARALALGPELLICDEPVSALDVSVQAQVLNLLKDLQKELGLAFLFVSHNLAVVDYMADRIAVMCAGRIVEIAPREKLMREPVHPYTRSLLAAVPFPDLDRPLNFNALRKAGASNQSRWPAQFRSDGDAEALSPADLGGGHFVLTRRSADARELAP